MIRIKTFKWGLAMINLDAGFNVDKIRLRYFYYKIFDRCILVYGII